MSAFEPFQERTLHAKNHLIELVRQLVQHNLRVIEKYYSRISLGRMSQLVGVSVERTENELGDMVVNNRIGAKINRLAGIVNFNKRSLTLDFNRDEGMALFRQLIGECDVLVENYSPRVFQNFGLTWDEVKKINPGCLW